MHEILELGGWTGFNHISSEIHHIFTPQFAQSSTYPRVTLKRHYAYREWLSTPISISNSIVTQVSSRINILKALADPNWGQQMETIIITYISHVRSLSIYATPIYLPNTSSLLVQKLQTIQNSTLHVATGCVKMAFVDHLLEETKMLPLHDHLSPICSQYLARTIQLII